MLTDERWERGGAGYIGGVTMDTYCEYVCV